jgi:hypothetical protein
MAWTVWRVGSICMLDSGVQGAALANLNELAHGQNACSKACFECLTPAISNERTFVVCYENVALLSNMSFKDERVSQLAPFTERETAARIGK